MSLNDFVVLSKIGEGAYSSVHKVRRVSDDQIYALKQVRISGLNDKEKQNALNEVRLLASINSDYVIKYKQAFFDQKTNTLCIVIEFAEGGDLQKVIDGKKKSLAWVEEAQILKMMRHVVTGLAFLHERSIIHRDLKSANIFISNGNYKIADLNVSKLLKKELAYTQTGTPYYASPEVWQDKPYQLKSDIWSFGCIAYELCALKPPFTATNMEGLFRKVMKGVYPKIPSVYSFKLAKIIEQCLQLEPAKRPTAHQLLGMLDEGREEIRKPKSCSINLLSTIKVPKNMESLKNDLPKADYTTFSEKSLEGDRPNRSQAVDQNRLREIVRLKNEEMKQQAKRVHSEAPLTLRQEELLKLNEGRGEKGSNRRSEAEGLPKIKKGSEPSKLDRVNEMLVKMREQVEKYDHYRPAWWG